MNTFIEYFFAVALCLVVAAGFIFLWNRWNTTKSPLALALAIGVTVLMAIIIAFSLATVVIYLLSL